MMRLNGDTGKLEIKILRRINYEVDDYWDANWLESKIKVDVPGFNALYETNLRVDDLQRFYGRLVPLQDGSAKKAEFTTMEEGLYLYCEADPNGQINCKGIARNAAGSSLRFKLQTDTASLDAFTSALRAVLAYYPLVRSLE